MLPTWMIEELEKQRREREREERPRLHIESPAYRPAQPPEEQGPQPGSTVVVIEIL